MSSITPNGKSEELRGRSEVMLPGFVGFLGVLDLLNNELESNVLFSTKATG